MNNRLYFRLAAGNIRKNAKSYVPFIITSVITAAMYFIISSLAGNKELADLKGAQSVTAVLGLGTWVTAIFAVIFLFYTNSFLMKRRKKEIGLWNILGMEKRHIAKVILIETVYVYVLTVLGGLLFGLLLNKLMFLLVTKMIGAQGALVFHFKLGAVGRTLLLFGGIFLLIFLESLRQVTFTKPIELLHGSSVGEKEPKAKWVLAVLGAACLGTGYYLAVSIKNPVTALSAFFIAVILVIVGTYLVFTAGSIAVLKLLKKNKRYYYKTKHFISVSGMMYRMKQNAVGLGNICILSTMVLVMISSTSSLIIGVDDVVDKRCPRDFLIYGCSSDENADYDAYRDKMEKKIKEIDKTAYNIHSYRALSVTAVEKSGSIYDFVNANDTTDVLNSDVCQLEFMTVSDYNDVSSESLSLGEGEVYIYSNNDKYSSDAISISGREYAVKGTLDKIADMGEIYDTSIDQLYVILDSDREFEGVYELQKSVYSDYYSLMQDKISFDTKASKEEQSDIALKLSDNTDEDEMSTAVWNRAELYDEYMLDYGGLLFIGIFLGLLFTMAAILIIYYKQISEGYDDKQRFEIMQKVGMTHQEVKSTIRSQILTVFFLPLITSGAHVAFALPMITQILELMGLTNSRLYLCCTLVSFGVFAAVYAVVYGLTAKVYYRIVKR